MKKLKCLFQRLIFFYFDNSNKYPKFFNKWFAGVIDSDSHFIRRRNKLIDLVIVMELNNLPLLEYIRDQIGYSVVNKCSNIIKAYCLWNS